ncbi:hypothetical protein RUM44_006166 [Polyplax serrata]|uniref:Uncharacterized protein n=1 Tax=Polyplax serrata TaxID=468196 RepID=A0ABR1B0R7_POLSC
MMGQPVQRSRRGKEKVQDGGSFPFLTQARKIEKKNYKLFCSEQNMKYGNLNERSGGLGKITREEIKKKTLAGTRACMSEVEKNSRRGQSQIPFVPQKEMKILLPLRLSEEIRAEGTVKTWKEKARRIEEAKKTYKPTEEESARKSAEQKTGNSRESFGPTGPSAKSPSDK